MHKIIQPPYVCFARARAINNQDRYVHLMPSYALQKLCKALHRVDVQEDCCAILAFGKHGGIRREWAGQVPAG